MIIANRTQELLFFHQMVEGSIPNRVLLIKAESGLGKTSLLARFKHTLSTQKTLCVDMDLKSAQLGISYFFSRVRQRLGEQRFPCLNAAVGSYLSSGIEVSDTKITGNNNQFSVVLSNVDENTRNFRLTELREAFFRDLRKIPQKLVFLFDTYEKAPSELANWLGGEFLADVVDTPKLIVVIAGQQIPQPTIEWMDLHECCCLEAILDREAWYKYSQDKKLPFNQDEVKMAMRIFKGHPQNIDKTLQALKSEQL
ncbi:ATP-binding protein [Anabaena sp. FACHB-709]|uniref:Uncharacterized protein n=2 Tax=Nostocaceae TaxID=1162 RepID=A0A1Z4KNQ9_ANAVA|nr:MULTISPECIES: ATP-binding protein [Nostocaceae]BAY70588.1 hypothetical protein NIES23_33950 [Trichormus variabilis NIES-23]HBW31516.1 ATP-binding protein [Nostoc sp. UBA8866]MBD2172553.1 ATP-binding protein [Anabaena cylindrica FACHB-318]MBD2264475.1 ATP-binding protein [Anabaena sp. FACHB-709]MBD2274246.1 ATP-binding protein [Nostoc sp. PCC 7120 = FACHB-418]